MSRYDERRNERRFAFAMLALLTALGIEGAVILSRSRSSGQGLLLIRSPGAPPAAAVVAGQGVPSRDIDQRLLMAQASTGGDIEVSLAWNSLSDLDLQVRDPAGELITAAHTRSASGGVQDVDANPTLLTEEGHAKVQSGQTVGPGDVVQLPEVLVDLDDRLRGSTALAGQPDQLPGFREQMRALTELPGMEGKAPPRFSRTPVEHIYFARAPKGTYAVFADCYSWRGPTRTPLPFTVQVRSHGKVFYEMTGTLGPASVITDRTTPTQACQFVMR